MKPGETVNSADGSLRVTLMNFNPETGIGHLQFEELASEPAWYYVTARFENGGEHRIDYKTFDVNKSSVHAVRTINRGDAIAEIRIIVMQTPNQTGGKR